MGDQSKEPRCPHCGQHLPEGQTPSPAKAHLPAWFRFFLIIVAVIGVIAALVIFNTEDITDAVEGQLNALKEGRITEAYYHFTSKEFQESTSLEAFHNFVDTHHFLVHAQSVRFIDRSVDNDKGGLDAMIFVPGENEEEMVHYRLIKEDDRWKILSIKVKAM